MPGMNRMILTVTTILLLVLVGLAQPLAAQDEVGDLLARVNNLRASVGVPPYSLNGALSAAAQNQAQWMAETGMIAHTRPDGSGPRTRALAAGYPSSDVSENIYGGTNASVSSAWNFWVNSGVHYAGLVNSRYSEIGIGIARSAWGAAYVLVFGNAGGGVAVANAPAPAAGGGSSGGSSGGTSGRNARPSVVILGTDERGNIQHQVQLGDTLGDIALIYGYSWDDIPMLMALNDITDVRDLDAGSVFLVPPRGGTFTPTPGGPTETPLPTPTPLPPTITPFVFRTATPIPALIPVQPPGATVGAPTPSPLPTMDATKIAVFVTAAAQPDLLIDTAGAAGAPSASGNPRGSGLPGWLIGALLVQGGIVAVALIEYLRRLRLRR
jgi:hypothetical protein